MRGPKNGLQQDSWGELAGARPRVNRCGIHLKDMETLFVWVSNPNLYRSQKFEVFDVIKGVEYGTKKVDKTY